MGSGAAILFDNSRQACELEWVNWVEWEEPAARIPVTTCRVYGVAEHSHNHHSLFAGGLKRISDAKVLLFGATRTIGWKA